jgi:hypothetical protein
MAAILTIANQIQCPHGGSATLETSNTSLLVDGEAALLESDIHQIAGCTFTPGTTPSPCVLIQWSGGASLLQVDQVGVLLESSTGMCLNGAGATQGTAMIVDSTSDVDAL